jgi:uncharacterized membrane protein YcaP (DUF421 family)
MNDLPGFGSGPLDIVVRTAIIFAFVAGGLRLGGKREVGQLSITDLVALLLLSNAVQNAMVGNDTSLGGGLIAAGVILLSARVVDLLARRFRSVRRVVIGEPRILIRHGDVMEQALRQEDVSRDELMAALREHGLEQTRDAKLAILEVDGSISVIPEPEAAESFQPGGGSSQPGGRRAGRIPRHAGRVGGSSQPTPPGAPTEVPGAPREAPGAPPETSSPPPGRRSKGETR